MKVIGIKHKVDTSNNVEEYVGKIAGAMKFNPDIIFGPDYALSFTDKEDINDFNQRDIAINKLEELSKDFPKTIILPGTGPFILRKGVMGHAIPMISNGKTICEFRKETNVGDSRFAKRNGLVYERGDSSNNKFYKEDKKITVEICSDHGKQRIDKDTYLELISAYDDRAGFYLRPGSDDFSRFAIVADGFAPKVDGFYYDHISRQPRFLEEQIKGDLHIFDLQ
jgi:hypothetical protein